MQTTGKGKGCAMVNAMDIAVVSATDMDGTEATEPCEHVEVVGLEIATIHQEWIVHPVV